jgi:hypothetical protein
MAELGKTVHVLFQDGQEGTFTHVLVDQETAGWLFIPKGRRVSSGPQVGMCPVILAARHAYFFISTSSPSAHARATA